MFRPLTYEERLDHPRRCTARRRDGEPCGKFSTVGASVCYAHGGWSPQVRRKALLRRMLELDRQAQGEAAFNILLPPEIHPLVGGGGRGHKKAPAQPAPTPAPDPRQQNNRQSPFVIDVDDVGPARPDPLLRPPATDVGEMRGPFPSDDDDRDSAPPTGPQLTTLEEAVAEQARAGTRGWRAARRRY